MSDPSTGVTVVIGAGGSLGLAIVNRMLTTSSRVIAVDRNDAALEPVPHGADREVADVTDPADVDALFDRIVSRLGGLSAVIDAVGGFRDGDAVDSTPEDFRAMMDINLGASWWISRAAAARMRSAGRGAIVLVGAGNAVEITPGAAAYSVSKGAVVQLTRVLDAELRESGIRVNAILPRLIDTPANRASMPGSTMRRAVSPDAIARVIEFLVSEDAAPIVGAVIPVYGAL